MPYDGDREELKQQLVRQFTSGRTEHVSEMTRLEYLDCCSFMERKSDYKGRLKKKRSECLHSLQKLGVDTSDWQRVNDFCQNARIAGKPFAQLSLEELGKLRKKLFAIERSGGLKPKVPTAPKPQTGGSYTKSVWVLPIGDLTMKN